MTEPLQSDRRSRRLIGRYASTAALLTLLVGCGYSSEPLHPQTVRTVYVEMAKSREFRREIEFQLTEALRKQIDVATPYRNAPQEKADTVLSAEILEWRETTLGRNQLDRPRETAATLVLRYRWQDLRTGRLLRDRPQFVSTVSYVRPAGETFEDAVLDAVNKHARNIVHDMETAW